MSSSRVRMLAGDPSREVAHAPVEGVWMTIAPAVRTLEDGEAGGASASSGSMRLAVGERWSGAHCAAAHAS